MFGVTADGMFLRLDVISVSCNCIDFTPSLLVPRSMLLWGNWHNSCLVLPSMRVIWCGHGHDCCWEYSPFRRYMYRSVFNCTLHSLGSSTDCRSKSPHTVHAVGRNPRERILSVLGSAHDDFTFHRQRNVVTA